MTLRTAILLIFELIATAKGNDLPKKLLRILVTFEHLDVHVFESVGVDH